MNSSIIQKIEYKTSFHSLQLDSSLFELKKKKKLYFDRLFVIQFRMCNLTFTKIIYIFSVKLKLILNTEVGIKKKKKAYK